MTIASCIACELLMKGHYGKIARTQFLKDYRGQTNIFLFYREHSQVSNLICVELSYFWSGLSSQACFGSKKYDSFKISGIMSDCKNCSQAAGLYTHRKANNHKELDLGEGKSWQAEQEQMWTRSWGEKKQTFWEQQWF